MHYFYIKILTTLSLRYLKFSKIKKSATFKFLGNRILKNLHRQTKNRIKFNLSSLLTFNLSCSIHDKFKTCLPDNHNLPATITNNKYIIQEHAMKRLIFAFVKLFTESFILLPKRVLIILKRMLNQFFAALESIILTPPGNDEIKDNQWLGVTVRSQGVGGKVMVGFYHKLLIYSKKEDKKIIND